MDLCPYDCEVYLLTGNKCIYRYLSGYREGYLCDRK
nr:MAG TPA: hypothetical protein [Caudoviricetes sp.]